VHDKGAHSKKHLHFFKKSLQKKREIILTACSGYSIYKLCKRFQVVLPRGRMFMEFGVQNLSEFGFLSPPAGSLSISIISLHTIDAY
jgi:hypothetical protein